MNIVKMILDQLSGSAVGQLGSLLGTDEETTERAVHAAVPSLFSALAAMASSDVGARKLADTLGSLDTGGLGNITQMLGGNASSVLNKGTSLLGSLFGDSMTSSLAGALSRYVGMNPGSVKSLLAYLLPLVLGKVGAQWKDQGGSPHALKNLFAAQRDNIAGALPTGLSLADIPGAGDLRKAATTAARTTEAAQSTAGSAASWLLPVAIVLLGGFLLWQFLSRRDAERTVADATQQTADRVTAMKPVLPDGVEISGLATVREDVSGMFKSLDTAFTDIRDAASAERAMPALRDLNTKIDAMNETLVRLPAEARTSLRPVLEEQVKLVTQKATTVNSIEGIGAQVKALIQEIITKITKWISADTR
jgi:hypothetical protein